MRSTQRKLIEPTRWQSRIFVIICGTNYLHTKVVSTNQLCVLQSLDIRQVSEAFYTEWKSTKACPRAAEHRKSIPIYSPSSMTARPQVTSALRR